VDTLRRTLDGIGKTLGTLGPSQRLLIAALAVILLMCLFLASQYAGSPKMVPVIAGGTSEEMQKVADFLLTQDIPHKSLGGKIYVPAEKQYSVQAQLARASALPADKKLLFSTLQDSQDWIRSRSQLDQRYTIALANELSQVIRNFPGVTDASVFISAAPQAGLGAAARKPTAQVTVFTRERVALDQSSVDALADLVAGSVSGLDPSEVKIVDGTNRRRYRANQPNDFAAASYLEQAAKVEERIQNKIVEHLSPFIPSVIVSVNAIVDGSRRESRTESVLPKGEGTLSLLKTESTSSQSSTESTASGAEPGLASNVSADINRGGSGAGKSNTANETSDTTFENGFGHKTVTQVDPTGKPLKINVAVSVPKDYIAQIIADRAAAPAAAGAAPTAAAGPTDDEVNKAWETERPKLEAMLRPLIETEVSAGAASAAIGTTASAGSLVVSLIPIAMTSPGAPGGNTAGLGGLFGGSNNGGAGGMLSSGLVKQVALGALAALSIGLMLLMVKKAGKAQILPTAEELVGIPPALQPNSDLVGEAEETDAAMLGIEVGDDELKTDKMLEQVTEMVKSNPQSAATVFNRWLAPEA